MLRECYYRVGDNDYFCGSKKLIVANMQTQPTILIVEDEESISEVMKLNLSMQGYRVQCVTSAEQALRLPIEQFDLLLLDVMMEEMDGYQLAREIRSREACRDIPIIFCTARDTEDDLLQGFASGGDDYIKKPFSMRELVARVGSVLRRSGRTGEATTVSSGTLVLDSQHATCTVDGEEVALTRREFDLLDYLMRHPGRIFSREELLQATWGQDVYVVDRTIDVNINRLRKKLGPHYGSCIITKQGFGYGFRTQENEC